MSNTDAEISTALLAARRGGAPISVAAQASHTVSHADAYKVQSNIAAETGAIGAWKVGRGAPGAEPFWAPIFERDVMADGTNLARPSNDEVGIEVEIAFRLNDRIGQPGADNSDPRDFIASAHVVIETVESRLAAPLEAVETWKISDNLLNGGLVVGPEIPNWRDINLESQHVQLEVDGTTKVDQKGSNPGGDPFKLLSWTLAQGKTHCGGLKTGQLLTTGSLSGLQFYPAGSQLTANYPDLGLSVSVGI